MVVLTFTSWKYSDYFDFWTEDDMNIIVICKLCAGSSEKHNLKPPAFRKLLEMHLSKDVEDGYSSTMAKQTKLEFLSWTAGYNKRKRTNEACGWICGE